MLELYPEYSISVTLFDHVSNMSELKEMLIKGTLEAALVNATMVYMKNTVRLLLFCCDILTWPQLIDLAKITSSNCFNSLTLEHYIII